jgi:PAS domain S-box-containing protein
MKDEDKSKAQLIDELVSLRQQVAELKSSEAERKRVEEQLRYQADLVENVSDAVISTDLDFNIKSWNKAAENIYGWQTDEVIGKPLIEVIKTEYPYDRREQVLEQFFAEGEWKGEVIQKGKGDVSVNILASVSLLKDGAGKPVGTVALNRDITERKRVEEALRESEERFRTIFESAPIGICLVNEEGKALQANRAFQEIFGSTEDELRNKTFLDYTHPDDVEESLKLLQTLLTGKNDSLQMERRYYTQDGHLIWAQVTVSTVRDAKGKFQYLVTMIENVTKRKRVEESLRESEERYRDLINASPNSILVIQNKRFVFANSAGARMFGLSEPEQLVGRYAPAMIAPAYHELVIERIKNVAAGKDNPPLEMELLRTDGTTLSIESTSVPIMLQGEPAALIISQDITERKQAEEALRESERFLQDVFDGIQDGISVLDPNLNITQVNRWIERMHHDEMPLIGKKCYEVYQKRKSPCPWCPSTKMLSTGKVHVEEVRVPYADGSFWWCELSAYPLKDANSKITGVIEHVKDITERKQAEEALRESEEKYRLVSENIPVVVYSVLPDEHSTALFISGRIEGLTGYSAQEFFDDSGLFTRMLHPEDREYVWEKIEEYYTKKIVLDVEYRIITKNNTLKWIRDAATPMFDEQGEIVRINGFVEDITERKRAEKALRETEERYRRLIESSDDLIFSVDRQGILKTAGGARLREFGLKPEDVVSRSLYDLFPEEEARHYQERHEQVFESGTAMTYEHTFEFAGLTKTDLTTLYPIKDERGQVEFIGGICRDITERKRAEEQIQVSLREKEALLREVHHRVKNNLQVVCALLDLQADAVENEQVRTAFQESQHRIRSMAQIHEQLTHAENLAQIDMAAYVQELVTSLRVAHGTDAVAIKMDVSNITLPFDAVSPCGLLINELVSNALKHAFPSSPSSVPPVSTGRQAMGEGNEIRITLRSLSPAENKMELTVSDNGVGLPTGVDPENPISLGLTLVKLLTRQLKATLEVKREAGTTFKIVFAP